MLTTSSLLSLRGSLVTTFALAAAALLVLTPVLQAQAPSKTYYVPVYESDFAAAMQILEDDDFGVVENVETVVSIVATVDGTVVYYDHVEDGYELDIGDPIQPTTQVWNLDSGDVLGLRNTVPGTGPLAGTFPYSGGDRIATSRTVAVTRVGWDAEVGTVIAGAFEVLDTGVWGTEYVAPVGEDVASFSMFEKTFLYVMAKETTNVSVVYPGQPAQNFVLPQGGSLALANVTLGTRVTADAPVQAHVIVGDTRPEGSLEMRCYTLYPVEAWSASYFSPVGNSTLTNDLTTIWLYNDGGSAITVNFDTQGVADDASFPVGAGSVVPFDMPVALGGEFSSSDGPFYALATVNSPENQSVSGVTPDNDTWDWGFTLVPSSQLSPMAIVGWGPGEKDTPLDDNGSPVWVTAPADTTVYISYNGDLVEETAVAILAFESLKIFDPDNDQTGLRVFTRSEGGQPPVPLAVAWGEDPDTAGPGNPYLDLGTTVLPIRALGLLKEAFLEDDVDADGVTSPGDILLYELKVINEGTATVHNVVLADEVPAYTTYVAGSTTIDGIPIPDDDTGAGAVTEFPLDESGLDLGDLGVGEEVVVTFEVAIDDPIPTDVNTIRNMAVVSSDETPPTIVEVEDPVIDPAIHLEKTVFTGAGDDTDCPGSEEVISEDGDTVTYCFEISNEGNVALTLSFDDLDLTIDFSDLLPVDDSALAVGETRTYYYQATVNGAWFDLDGNFENTAEVSGEPLDPNGDPIPDAPNPSDDDTANLTEARPELGLVKSSTTSDVTAAGQVVPYSYDLTNIGNVELNNVTLADDNTDAVPVCDWAQSSDGATPAGVLSVGETVTCTAVHTVTQAEIDAGGDLTNIATADSAETDEVTDRLDIPITQDPDLSVEKSSTTEEVTEAGQVVPYSYLVTNIGNMTLTNLTISDNNVDATPTCDWAGSSDGDTEVGILSPGEVVTCSADHTVSQQEIDAGGFLSNVVTVDSDETGPKKDDLDIPITQNPVLALDKSTLTTEVSALGAVPYTYVVTNNGNVTLTNVTLVDDNTDAVPTCDWAASTDPLTGEGILSPGEVVSCAAEHTVTQGELDLGDPLVNIATADSEETGQVKDTVSIPIVRMPVLLVLKTSLTTEVTFAGQVVDYSYKVTNDGNVTLTNITVTDNNVDEPPGVDCAGVTMLAPGAMTICTAQRTVTQAEIDAGGNLTNTVIADSAETDPMEDDLEIPIVKTPGIAFDKYVVYTGDLDESGGFTPGDTVTYFGYEVTNPSDVDNLDPTTVPDPGAGIYLLAPAKSCDQAVLLPGETTFCVATYVLSEGDLPVPGSMIDADSDGEVSVGDTLSYQFAVLNTGNVTLTDLEVLDPNAPPTCGVTELAPAASTICEAIYIVTQDDADAGSIPNTAVATTTETPPVDDTEVLPVPQNPALTLDKTADVDTYSAVGDVITYSYVVTNTGNVTLNNVTLLDPLPGLSAVTCAPEQPSVLAPTGQMTCSATYSINQADLDAGEVLNTATADSDETDPVDDSVTVDATQSPALTLDKTADVDTYSAVGDAITYSYVVTNTGNVTLNNVTLLDPLPGLSAVTCAPEQPSVLAPTGQMTCSATYSITQADLDAGSVVNVATADSDETDSVDDTVTVDANQTPALTLDKTADVDTYSAVGDVITYSYVVTNTGNVTLNNVTLGDPLPGLGTITCVEAQPSVLAPGGVMTCSASYTIGQGDLNAGSVVNTATADSNETDPVDDTVTVEATQSPALTLVKTATPSTYSAVSDEIGYSYLVTNTGNVSLAGPVTVADDKATATCPDVATVGNLDGALDPGESITCSATYLITQGDLNAGSVTNVATASADGTVSNQDDETVNANQSPALTLVKTATPPTYSAVGDEIGYSYLVTNTGNVSLAGPVTVADDKATATCPDVATVGNLDGALDPGESITCSATYLITQGDLNAGSVTNVATASADGTTSNQDQQTVTANQSPALTLVKTATPPTYSAVGDEIGYSYLVTNTGNVSLAGPVTVADDKATATCPDVATVGNLDTFLDPGESVTCSATYVITQGDLNAGSVTNVATASADGVDSLPDDETVTANQSPSLALVKTASPSTYSEVNDLISYSYLVTNTGNVSLSGPVTVADDKATAACPDVSTVGNLDTFLDPGESVTCSATYVITQGDLNAGSVTNVATASADGVDSLPDDETVTANQSPSLALVKTASPSTYSEVNDLISYSYLVTNTGNVSLSGPVTVADDKATAACPDVSTVGNLDTFLDPGESVTCTATYTITQDDLNAGSVMNVATASADGVDSLPDDETVTANQSPSLALVKTASPSTYSAVNDLISYSYLVTNTGNVSLSGPVTVADDKATAACPDVSTAGNNDTFLDPGESVTCEATYSITQDDLNAGSVTNMATASADGVDSNEDEETVTANQSPALTLVKTASPSTYSAVNDLISYSYLVTNTGNVSLSGPVTVADDKATAACPDVSTVGNLDTFLDPGESVTCTATYTITQDDLNAGSVTNTATASADGVDSNEDEETVTANQSPSLALVKTATPSTYSAVNDLISYSYLVTNTGNVSLSGPVTVADDKATAACPDVSTVGNLDTFLDPGESVTCTATYTITQDDLNAGSVTNTATASADGVDSLPDDETVTANQSPSLALVKTASPSTYSAVNDLISYSYLVTNTGNVSLSGPVTVADDKATAACPDLSTVGNLDTFLDPGESVTCTATYTITQDDLNAGSVTNMATASADGVDSNEDEETVTANQSPALTLVKTATPSTYSSTTDVISYSYLVTNSGNVSLSGPVTVADDKATVTCPDVSTVGNNDTFLDPGESVTCTATYTITQDDLNAGSVTNMATASADGVSSNQDQETVTAQVARVTLVKVLSPFEDEGRFDLLANGMPVATNVGNGQDSMLIAPGPLVVSEIGYDSNTDLADYNTNVACFDDATGAELGSAADTTLALAQSLVADQAVTCTFINFRLSILTGNIRVIKTMNGETPDGQAFTFEIRTGTTAEDPGATIGGPEVLGPPTYELVFNVPISPDYFLCEVGGNYEWLSFDGAENAFNPGDGDGGVDYGTVCLQVEPEITGIEINVDNGLRNDPRTIGYWGNHCEPNGNGNDDLTKSFIRDLIAQLDGRSGFSFVDPVSGTMNMGLGFVLGSNWTPDGLRTLEMRKGKPGGGGGDPEPVDYFELWNLLDELNPQGPDAINCEILTNILRKQDLDGKKRANDPAFKIASQLFAAELNQLNDAVRCQGVLNAIDDARDLLETVGFTGYGGYASAIEDREWTQQAIDLAETLDLYNNSNFAAACDYEPFDYSIDPLVP